LRKNLLQLIRYRGLISSLVARELKARYRGSVLGFLWSFINPLLLLSIYTFVFTVVLPNRNPIAQPYAVFMFCGILPWNWFSSSLMEASGSLVSGGNLIKKVLFPAEVLPIVSVLANMVHFFLGLLILAAFLIGYRHWPDPTGLIWFPVVVLVQLVFTTALALFLSALTVHYRDIRDLLTNLLMPGLNGRALAERLRQDDPHLRVLYTSGNADAAALRDVQAGTAALLTKPYGPTALVREVDRVLGG